MASGKNAGSGRQRLVEVRSSSDILATLDGDGCLDGLPFMPEMLHYCGQQIRVARRAQRTCVVGAGFRSMRAAVFLQDCRCDGAAHGGCQRACLLFWKDAWLRPARGVGAAMAPPRQRDIDAARLLMELTTRRGERYVCQSTALKDATAPLSRWDLRPFLAEVLHGDLSARALVGMMLRTAVKRLTGWSPERRLAGTPGKKQRGDLRLAAGELVDVKPAAGIAAQLDEHGANCGLVFQPTMHGAIGKPFAVAFPVHRIILEQSGKMVELSGTVALEGVLCEGACAAHCPRGEYLFWRESWLQRRGQ